jgi:hypothetical protein
MTLDRVFVHLQPEQIRTLLLAIAARLDGGFTPVDVEQFCSDLPTQSADDDLLIEPIVVYQGAQLPLVIDAFKHDSPSLELVFMTPAVLADLVEGEVRASFGDISLRRLPSRPGMAG